MIRRILATLGLLVMMFAWAIPMPCVNPSIVLGYAEYGAGYYTTEPIGGGAGYSNIITTGDYTVTTLSGLLNALGEAGSGDVIYIVGTVSINMGSLINVSVPEGVTVASNRGSGGSGGALIYTTDTSIRFKSLFAPKSHVTFNGLRIQGPQSGTSDIGCYRAGIWLNADYGNAGYHALEIENCEIYNWPYAGVSISKDGATGLTDAAKRSYIHNNYIHNCQLNGYGYGIDTVASSTIIEANSFKYCRHHIAGGRTLEGAPTTNYEVRYNVFGLVNNNSLVDCHGGNDSQAWGNPNDPDATTCAGGTLSIHHNTFTVKDEPSVAIRGVPETLCDIYNNWTYVATTSTVPTALAFKQRLENLIGDTVYGITITGNSYVHMSVHDNWYGTTPPPYVEDPTPPGPGDFDIQAIEVSQVFDTVLLWGRVYSDNFNPGAEYVTNVGFVWDTASHADPGDTAPAATAYGNSWTDTTNRNENFTISYTLTGLTSGETYYVRFGMDWFPPGDWEYGDEITVSIADLGCTMNDNVTGPIDSISETIGGADWSMNSILAADNYSVDYVNLLLYRIGNPTTMRVGIFNEVGGVPAGTAIGKATEDVSTLTVETTGQWVTLYLDNVVDMIAGQYYDLVVSQDAIGVNDVIWVSTTTGGPGWYTDSHDSGATWDVPSGQDGLYELWYCGYALTPAMQAPEQFVVSPLTGTEMELAWYNPNFEAGEGDFGDAISEEYIYVEIRRSESGYPSDPPSASDSLVVDKQAMPSGYKSYIDEGLESGTTYYYRIWFYDYTSDNYTTYLEDWATTYGTGEDSDDISVPTEWSQSPTCDLYASTPLYPIINGTFVNWLGAPLATGCVLVTLMLIGFVSSISYGVGRMVGTSGARTVAVPILTMAVLVVLAAIAHAIPLGAAIVFGLIFGFLGVWLWTRA